TTILIITLLVIGTFIGSFWMFVLWVAMASLTAKIAYERAESALAWMLAALVFGPLALGMIVSYKPETHLLPKKIECPKCGVLFRLRREERTSGLFSCPSCAEQFEVIDV